MVLESHWFSALAIVYYLFWLVNNGFSNGHPMLDCNFIIHNSLHFTGSERSVVLRQHHLAFTADLTKLYEVESVSHFFVFILRCVTFISHRNFQ